MFFNAGLVGVCVSACFFDVWHMLLQSTVEKRGNAED